jgi:hypothetical protein
MVRQKQYLGGGRDLWMVKLRLFANTGAPTHYVVVGEPE